jgi:hypothetical protein
VIEINARPGPRRPEMSLGTLWELLIAIVSGDVSLGIDPNG